MKRFRHKVYFFLDPTVIETKWEHYFDVSLIVLIIGNIIALMLDTVRSIHAEIGLYLKIFENVSIIIFGIEYILRVWSIVENHQYAHPVYGRMKFMVTPMAIIDLLAILPALLFLPFDLRFLRIVRVFRIFRLFKIIRYSKAIQQIKDVVHAKRSELLMSFVLVGIMIVIVSFCMFYIEHAAQPEKFSSVPETMWWSVATLTTVGYGDIYPITPAGQMLGGLIAILGIGLFAIPTGIIAAGYLEQLQKKSHSDNVCPACGQPLLHKKISTEE